MMIMGMLLVCCLYSCSKEDGDTADTSSDLKIVDHNGNTSDGHRFSIIDDENFYIAAEVDDPVHLQRFSGTDICRDDSLQIAFASGDFLPPELRGLADPPPVPHLNYGFALTSAGPLAVKYLGKDSGVKQFPVNVTRKDGQTFYEAAFPFAELGGRPARFGFVVFDNNYVGRKSAPYWLEFSPGIAGGMDASKLKLIQYK